MLIDVYKGIRIALKFLFYDIWIGIYTLLFMKRNPKIKDTCQKRVASTKKRPLIYK